MSALTVGYDHQSLLERINEGNFTRFRKLQVLELYYSDTHSPPGFYIKIGTRTSRLITPINVLSIENLSQVVESAEQLRPSPDAQVYDLAAQIVVTSAKGGN